MLPNCISFHRTDFHEKQCPCGATWTIHCRNKGCRWVVCASDKHIAVLDYKNGRLWGVVES